MAHALVEFCCMTVLVMICRRCQCLLLDMYATVHVLFFQVVWRDITGPGASFSAAVQPMPPVTRLPELAGARQVARVNTASKVLSLNSRHSVLSVLMYPNYIKYYVRREVCKLRNYHPRPQSRSRG